MALNSKCGACGTRLGPEDNDGPVTQPDNCARCRKRIAAEAVREANRKHPKAVAGRQLKALAMVAVIDANALAQHPPINPYDQAGRILLASDGWSDAVWEGIGVRAVKPNGQRYELKPISQDTRDLVRSVYRGRATAPVEHRVAS
jgi:hypothetical protein